MYPSALRIEMRFSNAFLLISVTNTSRRSDIIISLLATPRPMTLNRLISLAVISTICIDITDGPSWLRKKQQYEGTWSMG
jgi:hypothetical protein